jgi:hypothetical protein
MIVRLGQIAEETGYRRAVRRRKSKANRTVILLHVRFVFFFCQFQFNMTSKEQPNIIHSSTYTCLAKTFGFYLWKDEMEKEEEEEEDGVKVFFFSSDFDFLANNNNNLSCHTVSITCTSETES